MRHVFVQNAGAVDTGAAADPSAVADGVIAIFNARTGAGVDLTPATGATDLPDEFFIVQGSSDQPLMSGLLKKANLNGIVKSTFVAPVQQVKTVTVPAATEDGEFILKVIDETPGTDILRRYTVTAKVSEGEAAADIAAKLREALVNSISANNAPFTITGATTDIIITADDGTFFTVATDGGLEAGSVADTTGFDLGRNTGEQVEGMQEANVGVMTGRYNQENNLLGALAQYAPTADPAAEYLVYTILHQNNYDESVNKSFKNTELILALDSDVAGTFDDVFQNFLS